jgi:hypothetical protein
MALLRFFGIVTVLSLIAFLISMLRPRTRSPATRAHFRRDSLMGQVFRCFPQQALHGGGTCRCAVFSSIAVSVFFAGLILPFGHLLCRQVPPPPRPDRRPFAVDA